MAILVKAMGRGTELTQDPEGMCRVPGWSFKKGAVHRDPESRSLGSGDSSGSCTVCLGDSMCITQVLEEEGCEPMGTCWDSALALGCLGHMMLLRAFLGVLCKPEALQIP